jgi:hypothetical protein
MTTDNIPTFTEDQTLEEKLKALEKANRGLVADLADKREALRMQEERLAHVEQSLSSAASENGEERPEERVNRLASDPDSYIDKRVSEAVTPLMAEIRQLRINDEIERAKKWVAKREKIDPDEVDDKLGDELARIGKERGLTSLNPFQGIKNSYEILLQERREREERENNREQAITNNGTENVRTAPRTAGRFTREQIAAMSPEEYTANEAAIKQSIRDGKLTYQMDRG